ncbi:hypothetical protein JCGZ_15842 [Jatropha curcas]|uniref:ENTH domain-containing protein n=2 Tax=Jatropha curcas TaxID=180498 RepID=A0A067LAA1_JATCU|nr:hypothetical protein JCGZ_15842 [Jatropha curcas]
MGNRKKLRLIIGFFKDKTSIIKATLSTKRHNRIQTAVIRATTRDASSSPSDECIAVILSYGHSSRLSAYTCIEALMDRLHTTENPFVSLKCLFMLHIIITKGSVILKDQLSVYPSLGARNFLNLSRFRDGSDPESWGLSSWVRWYAAIIEQNLSVSRFLDNQNVLSFSATNKDKEEKVLAVLSRDLLGEMDLLINFVAVISEAPDSLHLQRKNLIHEIVRLVSDDYRSIQREIFIRVVEIGGRIPSFSFSELTQLLGNLNRFESYKERLYLLFVNRNRNDSLWELVNKTKTKTIEMMKEKEEMKLLEMGTKNDSNELTRSGEVVDKVDAGHGFVWTRFD